MCSPCDFPLVSQSDAQQNPDPTPVNALIAASLRLEDDLDVNCDLGSNLGFSFINLITLNLRGFKSNCNCVSYLCNSVNSLILCVSEHWLHSYEHAILSSV